jgi:hypothetical protein
MFDTPITGAPRAESLTRLLCRWGWPILWALVAFVALATASPASAQFVANEGFNANGSPTLAIELQPYLYLPHSSITIGLARPPGEDITIDRPRPTLADVLAKLNAAFDCDCDVRYGNWSGEVNILYVSVSTKTNLGGMGRIPPATLDNTATVFLISPGIGYRVLPTTSSSKVSVDLRAGFTYASLTAESDFQAGEFAHTGNHGVDFAQPWVGTRVDYYPSTKWRIENTLALNGLGVDGGSLGWNVKLGASYLITKWLDVSFGYTAQKVERDTPPLPDGANRSVDVLLRGPYAALGLRF